MFMKKTKLLTSICAFLFVLSFAGCEESTLQDSPIEEKTNLEEDTDDNEGLTNPDDEKEKFTVWCPEEISSLTKTQIERYLSQFEGTDNEFPYKLVVENVSEGNALTNILTDITTAGDIFFFIGTDGAVDSFVKNGALSQVPDSYADDVSIRNDSATIDFASRSDTIIYAYPASHDNGYFAYYNKSILSEDDLATQEGLIDALTTYNAENGTNYTINFELTGGWYNAAYFFGAGCVSEWTVDDNRNFVDYYDTYNSNPAGYDALEGMAQLIGSGVWTNSSIITDFNQKRGSKPAVVVSGFWDKATAKQCLGDDFAATKLWTYTIPASTRAQYVDADENGVVESATYQLGSFTSCEYLGVRRNVDGEKVAWAHSIANYLTDEECQLERYYSNDWGPSNLKARENEDVAADEAFNALVAQNEYATMQGNYPGSWWDATETIGNQVYATQTTVLDVATLKSILSGYQTSIEQIIPHASSDACYAVTGNLDGSSWDVMSALDGPYAFTESNANAGTFNLTAGVAHGVWETDITLVGGGCYVKDGGVGSEGDGTELGLFRVVNYNDWSGNWGYNELTSKTNFYDWNSDTYGGGTDNNIGAIPGNYHLVFDFSGTTPAINITQ